MVKNDKEGKNLLYMFFVHRIDVFVRRLGGAYGLKITRSTQVSIASSLIAYKLNRPCRFIQSLRANMRAVGKRLPASCNYEVIGYLFYFHLHIYFCLLKYMV